MSTTTPVRSTSGQPAGNKSSSLIDRAYNFLRSIPTGILWILVIVWSIPTLGLLVNSFRSRDAQRNTGWWKVVPSELTLDNYDQIFSARNSIWDSLANSFAETSWFFASLITARIAFGLHRFVST